MFGDLKFLWKPLIGFFTLIFAFLFKKGYDTFQKNKGRNEVKNEMEKQSLKREKDFANKQAKAAYETMVTSKDVPDTWNDLHKLSQKPKNSKASKKK